MTSRDSSTVTAVANAYRGKRVLITGHTGFKGSWLAAWLHELGANVHGFALAPETQPAHFELCGLRELIGHHEGDVRALQSLAGVVEAVRPEIVFHLAAQSLVRASYADPKQTFDINVGGTVNMLECVRSTDSVRAVVMVTSDKCYENHEWVHAYRETDPMGGHDPYSASKGAAELVISAFRRSYFSRAGQARVSSVRAGNVIGGGDWSADRIVPDCVRALSRKVPIVVRNPGSVRPWQHVLEPLWGYLLVGAKLLAGDERAAEAFNFGPIHARHATVREIVERFVAEWGEGQIELGTGNQKDFHEAGSLRLASDKSATTLGWLPALDGTETVRWTAEWYRKWHDAPGACRELTLSQIRRYQDTLLAREEC